jgi:TonB family protein
VLLVGAPDMAAELAQTLLWGKGVERVFASTGATALEVSRSFHPSLVVVDGVDPEAAVALIQSLRESPGAWRSSLAVLARSQSASDHEAFLRAGANLVLEGPPDPAAWNVGLERVLAVPRRVKARVPVRLSDWPSNSGRGDFAKGMALDISVGGLFLETSDPLDLGAKLEVRFVLPGQETELRAVGIVVRIALIERRHKAAIEFLTLEAHAQDHIHEFMESFVPQAVFGRYEVTGFIGEGSMGRVYSAFDPLAKRTVAIKTLKPEHLSGSDADEYRRRFHREAQAAGKLVHPNIITIFDVGDDYFVMELLEGTTLRALLAERERLELDEAIRILEPVSEAVDLAHSMGTIHRDIKPANIMILRDGRPKVMDFGVAHLTSGVITASGQFFGSPAYMAPEQIMRSEASSQSDLFSLAIVAYEMLTGRKPFEGDSITAILYSVVNVEQPPPTEWNAQLPHFLDDVFRCALSKDPAVRFPGARAFVAALRGDHGSTEDLLTLIAPTPPLVAPLPAVPAVAAVPVGLDQNGPAVEGKRRATDETIDLSDPSRGWSAWPRPGSWRTGLVVPGILVAAVGLAWRFDLARRPKVLPPPPGIAVTTEPVSASVWLDGVKMGEAPIYITNLEPGVHAVKVGREGYSSAEVKLEVPADGPPVPMRFTLQPVKMSGNPQPQPGTVAAADSNGGKASQSRAGRKLLASAGWVREGDLVELGPGVTPPQKISGGPPDYPAAAKRLSMSGTVGVEITVTEQGEVQNPRIVESAGEVLDQAVLAAVRNWRYTPAEKNGVKVKVRLRVRQHFQR